MVSELNRPPYDKSIELDILIEELQKERGENTKPTEVEQILIVIRDAPEHKFYTRDLAFIFSEKTDPERLAQQKLTEVRGLLESRGIPLKRESQYGI
jgi:hypothetical protein